MKVITGATFQWNNIKHSLGVVAEVRFVRCFWPKFDDPTELFAPGSYGIEVLGPPTPRNIIFPPDTKFLDIVPKDGGAPCKTGRAYGIKRMAGEIQYTAELTLDEVEDLRAKKVTVDDLAERKIFVAKGGLTMRMAEIRRHQK